MTEQVQRRHHRHRKVGVWDAFVKLTIGNVFTFIGWCIVAIGISILIEWGGMMAAWWAPNHSKIMLDDELSFLAAFPRNFITGLYPGDIAVTFINGTQDFLHKLTLPAWADGFKRAGNGFAQLIGYGLESAINTVIIFMCRLAICVSAITGFILIGLVALIDGLTERDIRKMCGGNESAMRYHHAKRFIFPSVALAFGFYLTLPITIHPAFVFLPIMLVTGLLIYTTASTFKKFL